MKVTRFPASLLATKLTLGSWSPVFHTVYTMLKAIWPLFIPLVILLPWLNSFPYPSPGAAFSDLTISHYPNALYLSRELLAGHGLPLWSDAILSGYPFAANPLAGLWYPAGWLALIVPLPFGFNLLVALHLFFGGLGMYLLLKLEGLSRPAALLGGLAFEAMPKLFAHYGAGHLTLLYAVPWTPWLLLSTSQGMRFAFRRWDVTFRIWPPVILAFICLADIRWAAYAGVLWLAYSFYHSRPVPRKLPAFIAGIGIQLFLAGLLSAPGWLPLLEFTRLSTRAQLMAADVLVYSLPPARLLGLLFPDFGGFHEWMLYPGILVVALSLLAGLWGAVRRQARFWLGVAALSLLFSLGQAIPFMTLLSHLPGLDLLRVPSRALFLTGLSLAALGAYGLDHILAGPSQVEKRQSRLVLTALAVFALVLTVGIWAFTRGSLPLNFAWGAGFVLVGVFWIILGLRNKVASGIWLAILLGLCLFDWMVVDRSLFSARSTASVLSEGEAAARFLADQPGMFRVYSPSYSLPQQTAARYGLELADGVDPLQLQSYVSFMEVATGVPAEGYSVTMPPFPNGDPGQANPRFLPDLARLRLLNVRYLIAEFDLPAPGLELEARFGDMRVYRNRLALPRAWIQPEDVQPGDLSRPVELNSWSPNKLSMTADGPGLLVLSEIAYPGWKVWVDGSPAQEQVVAGLLRGVSLGNGLHNVVFVFQPMSVMVSLLMAGVGGLILILLVWLSKRTPVAAPMPNTEGFTLYLEDQCQ
jgi:hypothetical protein